MRKLTVFLGIIGLAFTTADAQKITGNVKDEQGVAVSRSTVSLLAAKDSSVLKLEVTNNEGNYSFDVVNGKYLVSISHIGYEKYFSAVFEVSGDMTIPAIRLKKASESLQGVTVTSKKPLIEVKADKTIMNVEGTINAIGNDVLSLLRKSPGVLVDKDDNLSLAGKNGVQVYIDGKPTPLSGTDLAAYLKNIQSTEVEAIEIITNPSAKYDAAGNAGIINIRLKKNKTFGTNGSVNAGYNVGFYSKYNAGLALNHRNKKVNLFGNYNYNNSLNRNVFNLYRVQLDTLFDQHAIMKMDNESHGFKAGMDVFINKRNTLGVLINGNFSGNDMMNNSNTDIVYQPTGVTDRLLVARNQTNADRNNVNFNLNYRYTDTTGRELNLDADYGIYRIKTNQLQPNYYYSANGQTKLNEFIYRFISPTDIDIYSLKGDYEQNFQ